jgi:hypothetical protein
VFVPGRSPVKYLTSSLGSCTLFIWAEGHGSLRVVNVTWQLFTNLQ